MLLFKKLPYFVLILVGMLSFSKCGSTQKLDKSLPIGIGEVYYQEWIAGVEGASSGFNVHISIKSNPNNIILDSVFFKGKQAKLEDSNNSIFIGRFKASVNKKQDIIMSSNRLAEYENKVPELPKTSPFQLKQDECVVSYKFENKVRYFKIDKILKKETRNFMSTLSRKQ